MKRRNSCWMGVALVALSLAACGRGRLAGGAEVSPEEFAREVEQAKGLVLVDFWATWCGPCKIMKPIFEKAEKDYDGRVKFVSIDVDANRKLARKYNVSAIPTFHLFKDGRIIESRLGAMTEPDFRAWLDDQS